MGFSVLHQTIIAVFKYMKVNGQKQKKMHQNLNKSENDHHDDVTRKCAVDVMVSRSGDVIS